MAKAKIVSDVHYVVTFNTLKFVSYAAMSKNAANDLSAKSVFTAISKSEHTRVICDKSIIEQHNCIVRT